MLAIFFSITGHAADFDYAPYLTDPWIKKQVEFWIKMYTEYPSDHGVLHDSGHVTVVYETLDFRECRGRCKYLKILASRERWKKVLRSLAEKTESGVLDFTADEKHVYELYSQIDDANKYYEALQKKRMRFQLGQKDRFLEALQSSGKYLAMMQSVFDQYGVPRQLTRIPFVESSFNVGARSKVGAAGMWQFMKATGKIYLKISDEIDERRDPVRSTEAAAQLLKANYDALGSWALAITAYNHGRKGMLKAVRQVGSSEPKEVIREFRSRKFGFASRNFFMEFLAASEVEKDYKKYFGDIEREKPWRVSEVIVSEPIGIRELSKMLKMDRDTLGQLNPSWSDELIRGIIKIPPGSILRVPESLSSYVSKYPLAKRDRTTTSVTPDSGGSE